jgi:hypothetical protein
VTSRLESPAVVVELVGDGSGEPLAEYDPEFPEQIGAPVERLAPLEAAVLDALSEADLRTAAEFVSSYLTDESQAAIADRLEAAADALHALEVES